MELKREKGVFSSFLSGAGIIAAGGLISKVIGAFYRIPLTNLIGAEGIGLYQMVFPVYCALLTLSSTGIPTALSKIISDEPSKARGYLAKSALMFGLIGFAGSLFMALLSLPIAKLQGDSSAYKCYLALSPSVFLVSVISCFRGYFQGLNKMTPTALSQMIEQIIKTAFGLSLCYMLKSNVVAQACAATLAVTASEVVACIYLYCIYLAGIKKSGLYRVKIEGVRRIFALTVPVGISAIMLPLGHLTDSFTVINVLGRYSQNATAQFGVYSGSVAAITGVPVAISYGIAVAIIPKLKENNFSVASATALKYTFFISVPFAFFLSVFSGRIIDLIYGGMSLSDRSLAERILALDGFSVVFLSLVQTLNSIMLAIGKQKRAAVNMAIGLGTRAVLCFCFVSIKEVGILGAVIASNLSYLFTAALSLGCVLNRLILKEVSLSLAKNIICSLMCVLVGLLLLFRLNGKGIFLLVSLMLAGFYLLQAWLLSVAERQESSKKIKYTAKSSAR